MFYLESECFCVRGHEELRGKGSLMEYQFSGKSIGPLKNLTQHITLHSLDECRHETLSR